jgi:hypothetical protein
MINDNDNDNDEKVINLQWIDFNNKSASVNFYDRGPCVWDISEEKDQKMWWDQLTYLIEKKKCSRILINKIYVWNYQDGWHNRCWEEQYILARDFKQIKKALCDGS